MIVRDNSPNVGLYKFTTEQLMLALQNGESIFLDLYVDDKNVNSIEIKRIKDSRYQLDTGILSKEEFFFRLINKPSLFRRSSIRPKVAYPTKHMFDQKLSLEDKNKFLSNLGINHIKDREYSRDLKTYIIPAETVNQLSSWHSQILFKIGKEWGRRERDSQLKIFIDET